MKWIDFFFKTSTESFLVGNTCIYVTYSIYKLNLIPSVSQAIYRIIDWLIFPAVVSEVTNQKSLNWIVMHVIFWNCPLANS